MMATIDSGGRVVIPKAVRDRLGLAPGTEVEILELEGSVEITPRSTPMRISEGEPVATTDRDMPVLTAAMVRQTIDSVRR
jgi:AbrB family looped-hinge helix DNA binding protein